MLGRYFVYFIFVVGMLGCCVDKSAAIKIWFLCPCDDEIDVRGRSFVPWFRLNMRFHFLYEKSVATQQGRMNQRIFRRKMTVQRFFRDAGCFAELVNTRGMKALSIEQIQGAFDYGLMAFHFS